LIDKMELLAYDQFISYRPFSAIVFEMAKTDIFCQNKMKLICYGVGRQRND